MRGSWHQAAAVRTCCYFGRENLQPRGWALVRASCRLAGARLLVGDITCRRAESHDRNATGARVVTCAIELSDAGQHLAEGWLGHGQQRRQGTLRSLKCLVS